MRRIARLLLAAVFTAAAGAAEKPPVRDLSGEAKHVVAAASYLIINLFMLILIY